MSIPLFPAGDLGFLLFPVLLVVYYLICWALAGKDPAIRDVTPLYEPPAGISPGIARYITTGGSDGTTLAAVLSNLAANRVLSIEPQDRMYRLELLQKRAPVFPEEAALVEALFSEKILPDQHAAPDSSRSNQTQPASDLREALKTISAQQLASRGLAVATELAAEPRRFTLLDPKSAPHVKMAVDAIQNTFRKNLEGVYFRWNFSYVFAGIVATFAFGLGASLFIKAASSVFLTLWLLLFTTIAGTVLAFTRSAKPSRPTPGQRLTAIVIPVFFFVLPGFLIARLAMPQAQWFVLALLVAVALNSTFMVLMRAPTAAGQNALQQLAGFREFLMRVERGPLERVNTPQERAQMMDRFLPYAIALGVKEGWGDTMAAALSNAIVER